MGDGQGGGKGDGEGGDGEGGELDGGKRGGLSGGALGGSRSTGELLRDQRRRRRRQLRGCGVLVCQLLLRWQLGLHLLRLAMCRLLLLLARWRRLWVLRCQ